MQTGKRVNKLNGKVAVNLEIGILVVFNRIESKKAHVRCVYFQNKITCLPNVMWKHLFLILKNFCNFSRDGNPNSFELQECEFNLNRIE